MDFEITPKPSPAEREALAAAFLKLLSGEVAPQAYLSVWRNAGIRENAGDDDGYATARPRKSPGASRA